MISRNSNNNIPEPARDKCVFNVSEHSTLIGVLELCMCGSGKGLGRPWKHVWIRAETRALLRLVFLSSGLSQCFLRKIPRSSARALERIAGNQGEIQMCSQIRQPARSLPEGLTRWMPALGWGLWG